MLLEVTVDRNGELAGPLALDFRCTLGQPCEAKVGGYELAATNKIVVIESGTCGGTGDDAPVGTPETWVAASGEGGGTAGPEPDPEAECPPDTYQKGEIVFNCGGGSGSQDLDLQRAPGDPRPRQG